MADVNRRTRSSVPTLDHFGASAVTCLSIALRPLIWRCCPNRLLAANVWLGRDYVKSVASHGAEANAPLQPQRQAKSV